MVQNENFDHEFSNSNMEKDGESKATKIEVGDNFVVVANELENGDPFFMILCEHVLHRCELTSYRLLNDTLPSFVYFHLVLKSKFAMLPNATRIGIPRFSMHVEIRESLIAHLEERQTYQQN